MTRKQIVKFTIMVEAGLGVVALLGGWMLGLPVDEWVRWSLRGLLGGLGGAAGLLALLWLALKFPVGPIDRLARLIDQAVKPLFRECRVADLVLISILAGLGEELFFRGLLQSWAERGIGAWFGASAALWIALTLTSILFGFAHCLSREYLLFAALLGFLLGALAIVTGDLLAPIVAHAGYDFVALLMVTRRRSESVA